MADFEGSVEKVSRAGYLEKLPPTYKNLPQLSIEERDRHYEGASCTWVSDDRPFPTADNVIKVHVLERGSK